MRINWNFDYDKLHLKEIVILIPKYHPNMVSFLTPILGLYGINIKEFINDFDAKTKFINFDIVVPTVVRISKIKTFEIILKTPFVVSILSNLSGFSLTRPALDLLSIYKISVIKSLFKSYILEGFRKQIYISLRKYISLVIKVNFELSTGYVVSNISENLNLLKLKFNTHNSILFKNLTLNRYGAFFSFNNYSGARLNYLKKSLSLWGISIMKIRSNFLSSFTGSSYFQGNTFFISSLYIKNIWNIFRELIQKKFQQGNFFLVYWKFGVNLIQQNFFKEVCRSFSILQKNINFYLLRILNVNIIKLAKSLVYLSNRLLFVLKYNYGKNANLSSNIT